MEKILLFFSLTLLFTGCNNKEEKVEHSLFGFNLDEIQSIDVYQMSSARV